MSEQTLKKLVGALVVLVALWGITSFLSSDRSGSRSAGGELAGFFDGVDRSSASAVRMFSSVGDIELTNEAGAWLANGFRTDSGTVARFWSMIEAAAVEDLIATNPANHPRMEIDDESALRLEVDVDGDTRTLLIGSQGPRYATAYARLPGEDEVYVLQADLRIHMQRQLNDWRNKRIMALDTTAVARVEVERDGASVVIVRGDSLWTFEDGGPTAERATQNLMMDLNGVSAGAILAEADSLAQEPQAASMTALDAAGQVLVRLTLGAGEADRWVRVDGDDTIYRLQAFRVDRLFPSRGVLTPEADEGGS